MKVKFILLTLLMLFSRGCDFYSSSLWIFQENGLASETNPLTRFWGVGWSGLIVSNALIITLIVGLFFYYCFRYKRPAGFSYKANDYKQLASLQYFEQPGKFYQVFYKLPKNRYVFLAHQGYVMTITIIIASLLATVHNLCQFYNVEFYNQYRNIVGRPLFVIYGLCVGTGLLTYRHLLKMEFARYKILHDQDV